MKKVIVLLSILFLGIGNVYAENCTDSELAKLRSNAENVKVNYEEVEEIVNINVPDDNGSMTNIKTIESLKYKVKINIFNITNDLSIVQTDDQGSKEKIINSQNTNNGNYSFINEDNNKYITYTFKIYSNVENCNAKLLRTITFKKPKLNPNYSFEICVKNSDIPLCKRYITEDIDMNGKDLISEVNKYLEEDKKQEGKNKTIEFFNNNKWYFIGGVSGIILVFIIYKLIDRKRGRI